MPITSGQLGVAGQAAAEMVVVDDGVVPLADYWAQLRMFATSIPALANEPEAVQRATLARWADELGEIRAVVLADGSVIPLSHRYLMAHLRQVPPDLDEVAGLLETLLAVEADWPTVAFTVDDADLLTAILEQSEFQYEVEEMNFLERWAGELLQRLLSWLSRVWPEGAAVPFELFGRLFSFGAALILIAILAYAFRGVFVGWAAETEVGDDGEGGDDALTAAGALQQAQTFSGAGDYRTAVRYLYLSSLLLLQEQGLLTYNRSLTNREYLRSVASQPELAEVLRDVIDVFDRVWYGFQSLDKVEYDSYAERVERLRRQKQKS